jgi:HlyD family secretion protein
MPKKVVAKTEKRRRRGWIALVAFVLLAGAGVAWYWLDGTSILTQAASAQTTPSYQIATARRGDLRISIMGTGSLTASQTANLSFSIAGKVDELDVALGDTVSAGQELAHLGGTESLYATVARDQVTLLQVKKELNDLQANASVSLAQAYVDWVTARQTYEDELLIVQRMDYPRCGREVILNYTTALLQAKDRLARVEQTMENKNAATDPWLDARNTLDTAQVNYDYCFTYSDKEKTSANAELDLAKKILQDAELQYTKLKSSSGIAPEDLALAESKVVQAETQLAQAKQELEGATLVAPIAGKVTYLLAGKGEMVTTAPFLTISDVQQPFISVQVDETDLVDFVIGNRVEVVFDALQEEIFTGTLVQVDPQISVSGSVQTVKGLIQMDESTAATLGRLPLGLNATVELITQEVKDVILVPVEAIRDLGDNQYAVFVLANGNLRLRTVELGVHDTTFTEITFGLDEGEVVSTGIVATSNQ